MYVFLTPRAPLAVVRNKVKFANFLKKRTNTNPKRGPIHFRSPARMFWRTVRGMLPHKTQRGAQALGRLQTYEGIPPPYDKMKKMVVPQALKVLRLKAGRRYTVLSRLASEFGWKHADLIVRMEEKRIARSAEHYAAKKSATALKAKATAGIDSKLTAVLAGFGH